MVNLVARSNDHEEHEEGPYHNGVDKTNDVPEADSPTHTQRNQRRDLRGGSTREIRASAQGGGDVECGDNNGDFISHSESLDYWGGRHLH